ncbi:single-stranded DNA-binding protein [Candidatus Fermentibacteria bacterium]|nr:single-stranded DNA-binding protein [Candidatus Fermentibacteria bacterium]
MTINLRMPSINRVFISGNLVADPRVNILESGVRVANFRIANNQSYRLKDGSWGEKTHMVDVVAWRKTAELVEQFLHKGSPVIVEGELQTSTWKAQDGTERSRVEILARRVQFLERQGGAQRPREDVPQERRLEPASEEPPDMDGEYDDIPF